MRHCSRCPAILPPDRKHRYCRACSAAYQREHRAPHRDQSPEQKKRNVARAIARVYQSRGLLVPQPCEYAGPECSGPIEKHHDDYDQPLKVRWVCRFHHRGIPGEPTDAYFLPVESPYAARLRKRYAATPPIPRAPRR